MHTDNRGFTIVELLIVIVVIAILAAITIVSYNGIQKQAQQAVVASTASTVEKKVEAHKVLTGSYPESLADCPSPAATNLCLPQSGGVSIAYTPIAEGVTSGVTASALEASYEYRVLSDSTFMYFSPVVKTTTSREYMQYVDLAPFIDTYGLRPYTLSFDIKSADISLWKRVQVYFQNGSSTKYGGLEQWVDVTTDWSHHELTFTAANSTPTQTKAMLAFYGGYDTGNKPTVKNVMFKLK